MLIYAIILLTGIIALKNIPLEKIPEVSFPKIYVRTYWSASPENVELFVTSILEQELAAIKGVDNIKSYSYENYSTIVLDFTPKTKMNYAYLRVNEVLYQHYEELPEDASYPSIIPYAPGDMDIEEEFISLGIFSEVLDKFEINTLVEDELRSKIEGIKGISGIELIGVEDKEVEIRFNEKLIKRLNVSLFNDILPAIRDYHEIYSVGQVQQNKKNYLLLVKTDFSTLDELKKLNISTPDGRNFRLGKLAKISWETEEEKQNTFRLNGNEVIKIQVYREPGSNVISLTNQVKTKMQQVFATRDFSNLEYTILNDTSIDVKENIYNLLNRIIFVVLIICFVLLIFFHKWRPTLTVITTIFFEVLITINVLYILGESLNYFSLTGLALAFGMLVDNAIVVYSNIHHYQEEGQKFVTAMKKSFEEIRWAIIAATLTNICVFFPFIYLQQEVRRFMIPFAITVGVALISSILVSFTFIPIALMKQKFTSTEAQEAKTGNFLYKIYENVLGFFLRHRVIPIFLAMGIFAYALHLFIKDVDKGAFFNFNYPDYVNIYISSPPNIKFETIDEITRKFENVIKEAPSEKIDYFYTDVNRRWGATIRIYFPEDVMETAYPFVLREKLIAQSKYYGGIIVRIYGLGPNFSGGGSYIFYKSFELAGYNYYKLNELTHRIADYMKTNPRIQKVLENSSYGRNVKQVCIDIKKEKLDRYKLKPMQIIAQLYYLFNENVAGNIITPEDEYDIKILPDNELDLHELKNYLIKLGNRKVKLSAIADVTLENSPYRITRENQQYLSRIEYEYRGPYKMHTEFRESMVENTRLPAGYKFIEEETDFSDFNELIENPRQLAFILGLTIILVFIILAMLFESYLQPFIIMMSIPLAFVGVSFTFVLFDITFDSSAFIGALLLCGIVVNNSIILVNRINQIREQKGNSNINEIIIQAARERAKPILITSLTTIFGLMPFILYTQESSSETIWRTLAFATVGGLTTSTLFTLFLTPVFYNFLDKLKRMTKTRIN